MKKVMLFAAITTAAALVSCRNGEEVLAVRLDKTELEIVKGESAQLVAVTVPAQDNVKFEWHSEDNRYVTVDNDGRVTAVAMKKTNEKDTEAVPVSVYVKYEGGAASCAVTVLPLEVSSLSIDREAEGFRTSLLPGETVAFKVKFDPEDADIRTVTWKTSTAKVATVDANGVVTAKGYGTATITAVCGAASASIDISVAAVNATAVHITALPEDKVIKAGSVFDMECTMEPSNSTDRITWASDTPAVLTIDSETGEATAHKAGEAVVTALANHGGCKDTYRITVVSDGESSADVK